MAEIIPSLNRHTLGRMTSGEKRVARALQALLDETYLIWYDIPIGNKRRYPDFIILHPERGILFLEVKDWRPDKLRKASKSTVSVLTDTGLVTKPNPLEQVRQYAYVAIDRLKRDRMLRHATGPHAGNLVMPYGWGVVLTEITRAQMERALPDEHRVSIFPDHLMIYKDEIAESGDAELFQKRLWDMFHYQFGAPLTLPQINRVRGILYPEIRVDLPAQSDLFAEERSAESVEQLLPDLMRVMDIQQELLARSLGEGHRVIHGVAGSGKTMILGFRCLYLAQLLSKPILVLCFNITLAAKLRSFISARGIGNNVEVYHFHDWCGQQLKSYHVGVPETAEPYWERQVAAVIDGVEKRHIPRAQYGAVLIDEGHDFEAEWLKLVVQMVDPESNNLLLLYDDAQSIYKKKPGLGFTLSSVGIEARGRTTVLRLNYRNTREILDFAYAFARDYLESRHQNDEGAEVELIEPESAGTHGPMPLVRRAKDLEEEMTFAAASLNAWHQQGVPWNHMALLYPEKHVGRRLSLVLKQHRIPHALLASSSEKRAYDPSADQVTVVTLHSSKGLEFPRVIVVGVGEMTDEPKRLAQEIRLLYVGMTRAQEHLLVTTSGNNEYSKRLGAAR